MCPPAVLNLTSCTAGIITCLANIGRPLGGLAASGLDEDGDGGSGYSDATPAAADSPGGTCRVPLIGRSWSRHVTCAWIFSFVFFSECDNVGARCPLGACTTHGSVVVTSTLSVVIAYFSYPSGFLVVFEKPTRSSFTFAFTSLTIELWMWCDASAVIGRQRSKDSRWSDAEGEGDARSVATDDTLEAAHEEAVINILRGSTMPVSATLLAHAHRQAHLTAHLCLPSVQFVCTLTPAVSPCLLVPIRSTGCPRP